MYEIDMQTRTLYAELLELMQIMDASRSIASLKGSFSIKNIKGDEYVYFQTYNLSSKLYQIYIGKRNEQTERLMHDHGKGKSEIAAMTEKLKRLSLQIMAGVRMPIDKPIARVIRSLAEAGVFKNGGVLIGTQAFKAAGLVLGACWDNATMHTNDIDIATQLKLSVAIPNIKTDIPAVLDNLEMGFFAVPELTHNAPSTRFAIKGSQLRLDVLTPKTKESESSVYINRFKCGAQPLDYLSYIMESPIPAVLLDTMPVLINIPQPVRYAMHKLIVSQVRDMSGDAKRPKDLFQAYQILTVLQESRPFDILPAWEDLVRRGPKWKKYAKAGFVSMGKLFGKLDILGISGVLEG